MDVLTCLDWNSVTGVCDQISLAQDAYLIPLSQQELIELMSTGGFSVEAFEIAFSGFIGIWAAGAATGLIIAQIRKLKP